MTAAVAAETDITPELVAEHGLSADEYALILKIMGREPNITELGVFSAMWSEHCSYKSSKVWLKTLPTEGPQVICGPGDIDQAHRANEFITHEQLTGGMPFLARLVERVCLS